MRLLGSRMMRSPWWLALPAVLILIGVLAYPLFTIFAKSLNGTDLSLAHYEWFFKSKVNLAVFSRTYSMSAWVTLICLVCAYPFAFALTQAKSKAKVIMLACVLVPFWVSTLIRTLAWMIILQDSGVINQVLTSLGIDPVKLIRTKFGVIIGMVQVLFPFMVIPLYVCLKNIDLRLLQAAKSLGAHPIRTFFDVYLPLSFPGIYAGVLLVFILALGFYITPSLLGGPSSSMLSTLIDIQVQKIMHWGRASAMSVILLISAFLVLLLLSPLAKRKYDATGGSK